MLCLNNVVFINLVLLCGDTVKNLGPEAWLNNNLSIVPLGGGGGRGGGVLVFKMWTKRRVVNKIVSLTISITIGLLFLSGKNSLAVINGSILSCGLLSIRKWYMKFLFLLPFLFKYFVKIFSSMMIIYISISLKT